MEGIPMSQSAATLSRLVQPDEANVYGNVHGGAILKYIDEAAAVAAWRHCRKPKVVTASFERMSFKEPVFVGDILHVHATVRDTGRTSMIVGVRVEAEEPSSGDVRHVGSAHVTFVALDKVGKPTEVPPVIAETPEEEAKMAKAKRIHEAIREALKEQ